MINISVVLYNTPEYQIDRLFDVCAKISGLHCLYLIDNSPQPMYLYNPKRGNIIVPTEYIYNDKNLGYGRAHNIALRKSIEDNISFHLVVNADIDFSATTIRTLTEYMNNHSDVALLSPKIFYPNGDIQYLCKLLPSPYDLFGRRFLPSSWTEKRQYEYELHASGYDKIMNLPYLSGCFMFLRVSALQDVGLFDERYFMYPEDIDLTRRLHRHYKTLFYPGASVVHNHERASYKSLKMTMIHIVNMCRYFNKWGWIIDRERNEFNQRVKSMYLHT